MDALRTHGEASAGELSEQLELTRGTIHLHLQSLEAYELVVKEDGRYRLGLRLLDFGMAAKKNVQISSITKPVLNDLAEETGANVWLIVEEHGWAVYLDKAMGENAFEIESDIGDHSYLHCLAAGKALLAHRPRDEVEAIIDKRGLPERTSNTITDRDEFFAELETIRDRGYAFNDEEDIDHVWGVGAPICKDDHAIGAVGIGTPAKQFSREYYRERLPELLLGATNRIELKLTYS
jgi:DNA-binding IclR family transcriptional regulator